jgi:hypothetical protein
MLNDILLVILGIVIIVGGIAINQNYICYKVIKFSKKEIERLVVEVFNETKVGEFFTTKSEQIIVITDKFNEDGKYYFEYKYFNTDAQTMTDIASDEKYVVTVQQFSRLIK